MFRNRSLLNADDRRRTPMPRPTSRLPEPPSATAASQKRAESQLASFVAKFEPKYAKLIKECRRELRKLLPAAIELVYDNYNFFVIGYCSSERASDCIVSLAAAANGVGLSFYRGAALADPAGILEGSGKQNRFVRLPNADRLRAREVVQLIHAAARQAKTGLPSSGRGYLVIKSVSVKQRPRRRSAGTS